MNITMTMIIALILIITKIVILRPIIAIITSIPPTIFNTLVFTKFKYYKNDVDAIR